MAFNINKSKEYIAWVKYPEDEDEQYKVKYIDFDLWEKMIKMTDDKFIDLLSEHVLDWKGLINSDNKEVEFNKKNLSFILKELGIESIKRIDFLGISCRNPRNFYNYENMIKNLSKVSK
jgi:hypothetical protein